MTISRLELKIYLSRQKTYRSNISNPQVKNTVTFKTLTYEIFLLGIVSTPILLFHNTEDAKKINQTTILVVLNLVNIVSNIFLLTYLFHNEEAIEYLKSKMKRVAFFRACMKLYQNNRVENKPSTQPAKIFTMRRKPCPLQKKKTNPLVTFNNEIALIELDS